MLKIKEAMEELNVSASWMDKYIKEGKVQVIWLGGVRRISEEEVDRIKREGVEMP